MDIRELSGDNGGGWIVMANLKCTHQLPKFSEAEKLKEHEVFSAAQEQGGSLRISETLQITHVRLFSQLFFYALMISQISAHFQKFVAYSTGPTSVVIMGDRDTDAQSTPKVIPELQNIGVISVVLGDYHCGALTEAGKLLTWGNTFRCTSALLSDHDFQASTLKVLWALVILRAFHQARAVASETRGIGKQL